MNTRKIRLRRNRELSAAPRLDGPSDRFAPEAWLSLVREAMASGVDKESFHRHLLRLQADRRR